MDLLCCIYQCVCLFVCVHNEERLKESYKEKIVKVMSGDEMKEFQMGR